MCRVVPSSTLVPERQKAQVASLDLGFTAATLARLSCEIDNINSQSGCTIQRCAHRFLKVPKLYRSAMPKVLEPGLEPEKPDVAAGPIDAS